MVSDKLRNGEAIKKPIHPSRIPKKGDRSPGKFKQLGPGHLKRHLSTDRMKNKDAAFVENKLNTESRDAQRLLATAAEKVKTNLAGIAPRQKYSPRAQELVKLIPTLSGLDITNLVASIKRRRLQRAGSHGVSETDTNQRRVDTASTRKLHPELPPAATLQSDMVDNTWQETDIPDAEPCMTPLSGGLTNTEERREPMHKPGAMMMDDSTLAPQEPLRRIPPPRNLMGEISRPTARQELRIDLSNSLCHKRDLPPKNI